MSDCQIEFGSVAPRGPTLSSAGGNVETVLAEGVNAEVKSRRRQQARCDSRYGFLREQVEVLSVSSVALAHFRAAFLRHWRQVQPLPELAKTYFQIARLKLGFPCTFWSSVDFGFRPGRLVSFVSRSPGRCGCCTSIRFSREAWDRLGGKSLPTSEGSRHLVHGSLREHRIAGGARSARNRHGCSGGDSHSDQAINSFMISFVPA